MITSGKLPMTRRLKAALEFAIAEADGFNDDQIRPDHILLGLCRIGPCTAAAVLRQLGVTPAVVCERVITRLDGEPLRWLQARPEVW
jgi:hypothetical protein